MTDGTIKVMRQITGLPAILMTLAIVALIAITARPLLANDSGTPIPGAAATLETQGQEIQTLVNAATLADLLPVDDDQPSTSGKATLADLLPDNQVNARLKVPAPDTSLLGTAGRLGQGVADNLTGVPRVDSN